jgi:hypothetical protein
LAMLIPWPEEELKLARAGRRQGRTCEPTNHVPSIVLFWAAVHSAGQEVSTAPNRLPDLTAGSQLAEGGDFPRTVITLTSLSPKVTCTKQNPFCLTIRSWRRLSCEMCRVVW